MVRKSTPASALISPTCKARWIRMRRYDTGQDAYVAEGRAHDDGLIAVLFVVVEDLGDGLHTRVLLALVVLASGLLVPVKNTADEGRDEGDASLQT